MTRRESTGGPEQQSVWVRFGQHHDEARKLHSGMTTEKPIKGTQASTLTGCSKKQGRNS